MITAANVLGTIMLSDLFGMLIGLFGLVIAFGTDNDSVFNSLAASAIACTIGFGACLIAVKIIAIV